MENKIQLKHPAGKKAVRIDKDKYDVMSNTILNCLKNKELTHTELLKAVTDNFKMNKIKFIGSIGWYMESVKLDLEANRQIERYKDKARLIFQLVSG